VKLGFAGQLAQAFVNSKLTPLIIIASLLLGFFAVVKTPREEEPQIIVPMADVLVRMPGASAKDIEKRISTPLEKVIWEIPGVEYVYSTSSPGQAMIVVRYTVGQDQERAFVRLRDKINSRPELIPEGASPPVIRPRSIGDVPVLALTLHSRTVGAYTLNQVAARVEEAIKTVNNVGETMVIGGRKREVLISLDRAKLDGIGLDSQAVARALQAANRGSQAGQISTSNKGIAVKVGDGFRSVDEIRDLVIASFSGRTVHLRDVATVEDGPEEAKSLVLFGYGPGFEGKGAAPGLEPGVTISVAKRQGVNAIDVVDQVLAKVETLKGKIIPSDITITITRNYGETASEKSGELLYHMGIAVVSVTILIAIALGRKESMVVLVAIPVTLALTLLVFYLYGYTLNRITLFALIFSIGILVDDAIVVVENIVRHMAMPESKEKGLIKTAIEAVDEVGNPTILATFAVIAAIVPMAFVGGLMGPYMRPIPVGASAAMIWSLLVAFVVTPWAAVRILRQKPGAAVKGHGGHGDGEGKEDTLTKLYRRIMTPLLQSPKARGIFFAGVLALLFGSMALVGLKWVTVKMLPFDNKNEFQVIVDMPTGTTLEQTAHVARALADYGSKIPEVTDYQIYIGASSPFNFNGLVRHYFMRSASYQADIQVNLSPKHHRKAQSHDIVKRVREDLGKIAALYGARIKVAEVPPGPPVLQTLVAEVYGPDEASRTALARQVKDIFTSTEGVSDVDWYMDDDQSTVRYVVDRDKAMKAGVDPGAVNLAITTAISGASVGLLNDDESREPIPVVMRSPREDRSSLDDLDQLSVASTFGGLVPLRELVNAVEIPTDKSIYHKNLLPVVYVTGDVVGKQESPVYAILKMNQAIDKLRLENGSKVKVLTTSLPSDTNKASMKWDGEWHITYEVFRDLGIAFAAVLVLIYILVVAWFQDFKTPLVIMAPIPLTLVGILPGHAMMGAFFTATSMIGFIAGAGIIVRNSIILVDFIELRRSQGSALQDAVIDAGAIRFRPMLLTAAAVIVGSFVILFDPIFQGLAISLMAGEIASTLLSRIAVPVLYYLAARKSEASGPGPESLSEVPVS
jgi:multidrug efflux pump subunit AcrB